ncbi:CIC11C00000000086 [Sungouiella intermedia]|uniref:Chromatin modification-related protein EAF3 n=1 Tax=Sungouiella intermedia TaxID=45354 RepID=A0A1L0DHL7_9ASCO|nr:CIC11C00000000086 [[Candida] intermedia]
MVEHEKFRPGTRVLAYHGPLVYEAKVLKVHEKGKMFVEIGEGKSEPLENNKIPKFLLDGDAYFLHYKGWSLKWDEWVSTERVMEFNDDNLGLSRELRNARKKAIEKMDPSREKKEEEITTPQKKRRKKESSEGPRGALSQPPPLDGYTEPTKSRRRRGEGRSNYEVMMPLHPTLKCVLVDDWEFITKDHKLVDLDKTTSVKKILDTYYAEKKNSDTATPEMLLVTREALDGLLVYFDKLLSLNLLYRFERLQYSDLLRDKPGTRPSEVYGVEHLLRLLVILPGQISHTVMDAVSINVLMGQMKELLDYIAKNLHQQWSAYMNANPGYDRLAKS